MKLSKDLTMSEGKFYTPDEVKPLYGEVIPAYQAAFALVSLGLRLVNAPIRKRYKGVPEAYRKVRLANCVLLVEVAPLLPHTLAAS